MCGPEPTRCPSSYVGGSCQGLLLGRSTSGVCQGGLEQSLDPISLPSGSSAFNPGGGGSPPPYAWHRYGNLQMLPRPTAKPTQLSRYCSLLSHLGLSSPLSPLSLLPDPQVLAMLSVGAAGNTTARRLYKGTRRSLLIANHQPGLYCPWASHPSAPKAGGSFTFSSPSTGGTGLRPAQPPTPTIMATVLPTTPRGNALQSWPAFRLRMFYGYTSYLPSVSEFC